jgi:DNA-binding MurR/RpiR family transcriptional regulator
MSTQYDFAAAEIDYAAGGYSINALAIKHNIPEPTLRRYAKKQGWIKGTSDVKRELVREAMAGMPLDESLTNEMTNGEAIRQVQLDEATQDVADMNTGLAVARRSMGKLLLMVDQVDHPKDVKTICEANKLAVETIRKIRALDDDTPPEASVQVEISDGFAELRAAFHKRLQQPVGAVQDDDAGTA